MTKKTFRLMVLTGLLVLMSLSAGCGLFGNKSDRVSELELQKENLESRLNKTENDLTLADRDITELKSDLDQVESENIGLKQQLADRPGGSTNTGVREIITVSGGVLFRSGSASLTGAGKSKLNSIASNISSRHSGRHISVEGHTDSDPLVKTLDKWKRNVWLSSNRAWAVADYLIARGISEDLVSVVGHGAGRPSGGGKAQDRRVEIVVLAN